MNRFTRRELAVTLSASAVLLAQPETPPIPANPAAELQASEAQLRDTAAQLDQFPLPMATEPVTIFKP
ncbi:MAG TPA: hypothetical protein VME17_10410 [Bryobacteraceae bacterium]|nr:hypothetical protein [Bryobacteraceae bacterium]